MSGVGDERQRVDVPAAAGFRQHIRKRQPERDFQTRLLQRAAPLLFVMMSVMRSDKFILKRFEPQRRGDAEIFLKLPAGKIFFFSLRLRVSAVQILF
jgi:hypothetical protein